MGGISGIAAGADQLKSLFGPNPAVVAASQPSLIAGEEYGIFGPYAQSALASSSAGVFANQSPAFISAVSGGSGNTLSSISNLLYQTSPNYQAPIAQAGTVGTGLIADFFAKASAFFSGIPSWVIALGVLFAIYLYMRKK